MAADSDAKVAGRYQLERGAGDKLTTGSKMPFLTKLRRPLNASVTWPAHTR